MKKQWLKKIRTDLAICFCALTSCVCNVAAGTRGSAVFFIMENVRRECRWKNMSMQWNDLD